MICTNYHHSTRNSWITGFLMITFLKDLKRCPWQSHRVKKISVLKGAGQMAACHEPHHVLVEFTATQNLNFHIISLRVKFKETTSFWSGFQGTGLPEPLHYCVQNIGVLCVLYLQCLFLTWQSQGELTCKHGWLWGMCNSDQREVWGIF